MNTNALMGIGLVVGVVVVGGGAYFLMNREGALPSQTAAINEATSGDLSNDEVAGSFNGSFADLAARGGTWKCLIVAGTSATASSGTVYVSGNNVSGSFTTTVSGYGSVESHMMSDGSYTYSWSSMMPQGVKVAIADTGVAAPSGPAAGQGADASQSYSYSCEPWTAGAAVFALPTGIKFTEVK